jgi:hypothetical protein
MKNATLMMILSTLITTGCTSEAPQTSRKEVKPPTATAPMVEQDEQPTDNLVPEYHDPSLDGRTILVPPPVEPGQPIPNFDGPILPPRDAADNFTPDPNAPVKEGDTTPKDGRIEDSRVYDTGRIKS